MASSLSPACNPPKQAYDACFNAWFKSYLLLVAPPLQSSSSPSLNSSASSAQDKDKDRARLIEQKKAELENHCGVTWREYQSCLAKEIPTKEDLPQMLQQARNEEPLDGWGGIKVVGQDDLK